MRGGPPGPRAGHEPHSCLRTPAYGQHREQQRLDRMPTCMKCQATQLSYHTAPHHSSRQAGQQLARAANGPLCREMRPGPAADSHAQCDQGAAVSRCCACSSKQPTNIAYISTQEGRGSQGRQCQQPLCLRDRHQKTCRLSVPWVPRHLMHRALVPCQPQPENNTHTHTHPAMQPSAVAVSQAPTQQREQPWASRNTNQRRAGARNARQTHKQPDRQGQPAVRLCHPATPTTQQPHTHTQRRPWVASLLQVGAAHRVHRRDSARHPAGTQRVSSSWPVQMINAAGFCNKMSWHC